MKKSAEPLKRESFLLLPMSLWLSFFFVGPLLIVFAYSFLRRGDYGGIEWSLTFDSYRRVFDPLYLSIYKNSLSLALITSVACILIGFPMAYAIVTSTPKLRWLYLFGVTLPFLCNFVVRIYSIKLAFGSSGPLNQTLTGLGLISEPLPILYTPFAVLIGMILNYLPFFILPLYARLERFDFSLLEAAKDLGASTFTQFKKIILPFALPGVMSGFLLVFIPSLGEFLIPDLLGGSRVVLFGNLVSDLFLKSRDWPFGSALTTLFVILIWALLLMRPSQKGES